MSFVEITKDLLNKTITEKGDGAYVSTLSPCLDYFALCGGKRYALNECASLFAKAYFDDKNTALKLLFFTRDIKNGLGERRMFRFLFSGLASSYPEVAVKLVPFIPTYGRYDDLICALFTPVEDKAIEIIANQLYLDIENKKAGKPISLLAKWMPSINTSSAEARYLGLYLAKKLKMSKADYRKTLSFLRKDLIIENNLREKDYTFDYSRVPSVAMNKYSNAFRKNDEIRFAEYLNKVNKGEEKMNVANLDVASFIKQLVKIGAPDAETEKYYQTTWDQMVLEGAINKRTLVVRDGSGSMYYAGYASSRNECLPIHIADALTLLTAARLEGEFHDKFITFSSEPQFVDLSDKKSLRDKLNYLKTFDDISTTDIEKVYKLILDVYQSPDFKKEDALEQILIVSDMEFDALKNSDNYSTFEYFKTEFAKLNYSMPEIVFWNVDSRGQRVPITKNEKGVKLVSGRSKNIIKMVTDTESLDPETFMYDVLKKYDFIDKLFEEEK